MPFASEQFGGIVVVQPSGEMDATQLPAIDAFVATSFAEGAQHVVFDLSRVTLLPSTAVGVLIQANHRAREAGGRLALACVPALVRGTLTTMGVAPLFRIYADVAAAVEGLS